MKKVIGATFALALALAAAAPASADPARASSAYAYGLEATGTLPIARTPESRASQPPDSQLVRNAVLEVPAQPLAVDANVGTVAVAHRESDIRTSGGGWDPPDADPQSLQDVNARGFARTTGLALVVQASALVDAITDDLITQSLVGAEVIQAEAAAKCVDNKAQFDTGYEIIGLGVAGEEIPLVADLTKALTDLLAPGGVLAPVVTVEKGVVSRPSQDTIAIDALVITVPLLNERIVVSHAEATMPTPCGIEPPKPTGPGPIAQDTPRLAATGGEMGTLPLVAFGVLGGAVILRRIMVRSYRRAS